jgi:tRNA threonylcarbamoyladenosine biosynthesis protein TsaB
MPLILCIETSTKACSTALYNDSERLNSRFLHSDQFTHSENLNPFILEMLDESGVKFDQLSAVAVSSGPGSYTGLRIGVSSAKGICYALEIPMIAIDTLEIMARGALKTKTTIQEEDLLSLSHARCKKNGSVCSDL